MKKIVLMFLVIASLPALSQNVGIGTNNPLSRLHVAGCIRSDTLIGPGVRSLFAAPNGRIYDSLVVPSALSWEINGNSNITPARFLGTTNANDVIFKTNSVENMRITNAKGNVGINYTAPLSKLTIQDRFDANYANLNPFNSLTGLSVYDNTDFVGIATEDMDGNLATTNDAGGLIYWGDDGNEPLNFKYLKYNGTSFTPQTIATFLPTGNVGIGTSTPNTRLEINPGIINNSGLRFTTLTSASPTVASNGKALSVNATGDVILVPASGGNAWDLLGNAGTAAGTNFLGTTDAQDMVFKTNNTEKMRITTGGQVGIGTAAPNPSAILQIVSTTQGVMFPTMTTAQRQAIGAPATGLMVYDQTANILMSYNGTRWQEVGGDPIGTIQAFHKSMVATPVLPWGWVECNGQVLADPESPYNGQTMPSLNATGKFLRGSTVSGTLQNEDLGAHSHTGTTSSNGSHNHGGSTGSVNSTNGRVVPWDDNLASNKMNAANTGQLGNTPAGGGGLPWDGLATVGNFITTIDQLDHTHAISADGAHTHTFTTNNSTGAETRPTNMSVVWVIRVK